MPVTAWFLNHYVSDIVFMADLNWLVHIACVFTTPFVCVVISISSLLTALAQEDTVLGAVVVVVWFGLVEVPD